TSVIENSAPANINLSHEDTDITITETESMELRVSAEDNDGDILSYRWTYDGRIVLFEEGVSNSIYHLKTDYDSEGEYILRLVISDGDDFNETTWTVNVQKKNRLPTITVVEPEGKTASIKEKETLNFAITKSDSDGDTLDVRWYLDGTQVWEGSDKYTYSPDYYSSGSHIITAEVYETESGENTSYAWTVDVADVEETEGRETFLGFSYDFWGLVLAIMSGIAAILISIVGLFRVRKKKGALKIYMSEIDEISAEEDEDPEGYQQKLSDLEEKINQEFMEGKLEDLHYLMLQEIFTNRRGEVRRAAITQRFDRLPEGVVKELDEMLKDGKISKEEYEGFVATISKTKSLSPEEKEELSKMIEEWEVEDKDAIESESPEEENESEEKTIKSEVGKESDHSTDSPDKEEKSEEE
ncbi:MAG: hypothetical protein JSV09_08625, partial [Thermoplasmata archaeon]